MKPRGRHAAPGPADRAPVTPAVGSARSAAPWDSTEVIPVVDARQVARRKLANYAGKLSALMAVALMLAMGVLNSGVPDAAEGAAANAAYLDLRDEPLTSRAEVDRAVLNEDRVVVSIEADGAVVEQILGGGTVKDALAAAGIEIGVNDIVSEHLETLLVDGHQISVQRAAHSVISEEVIDEHESTKEETDSLYEGEERVTTAGVDGHSVTTFRVLMVDGVEISRETIAAVVTQERVDEIISVGTKERPTGAAGAPASGPVMTGSNREIGQTLAADRGWSGDEWQCLDALWQRESNWNHLAKNSSSGAYGIPQSLPGTKMGSVAADWQTNPTTQITWGLNYISGRYGTPCGAWQHSQARGWY